MPELALEGCTPTPLGSYLKALGVLRVVGRQADPDLRGWWRYDVFRLRSRLDPEALVEFFVQRYRPTPAVSPWNGGSGFYPKDAREAIERIAASNSARLNAYKVAIRVSEDAIQKVDAASSGRDRKERLVALCRATLPDEALDWLDAALVLSADELEYPPLLVSGGNDGRLEFSNNFMQRLCDVLPELAASPQQALEQSRGWLLGALFGTSSVPLKDAAVGLFNPGAAGGANAVAGFEGASLVNPWDYVLMIEGLVLFAGAASKRLGRREGAATASFPFTVRPSAAGVLFGGSEEERVRAEIWMPVWTEPAALSEVQNLCAEGRAEWRGRQATDAVDFAKAVASLGVARGVESFVRFGLSTRMGRNHVAVPLRRIPVRRRPEVDLLAQVDGWLGRVGQLPDLPARLKSALRRVERASFELCLRGGAEATQEVMVELARAELVLAANPARAELVSPLELARDWVAACDDGSAEFRLAAALASIGHPQLGPVRSHVEPVVVDDRGRLVRRRTRSQVWAEAPATRNLAAVFQRRLLDASLQGQPNAALTASRSAPLSDVAALLGGSVDVERMASLFLGLAMVRRSSAEHRGPSPGLEARQLAAAAHLPRTYALARLCCLPFALTRGALMLEVSVEPQVPVALAAGRGEDAARAAAARLRASGLQLHSGVDAPELGAGVDPELLQTALLVPISRQSATAIAEVLSVPTSLEVTT